MITLEDVINNNTVKSYVNKADDFLGIIGYTEHGERHAKRVAHTAQRILSELEKPERIVTLGGISGFLHDIGNVVNRKYHAQTGAALVHSILSSMGMPVQDISEVIGAIGNHHEEDGIPVSDVGAALILSDKSDVHRSRVRNPEFVKFDIHDRVNYATTQSVLDVNQDDTKIIFNLTIDTTIAAVMEYFEIFLSRMIISRRAAVFLGCKFEMIINNIKVI
ncbi:MAG: HD domain-containing protein [Candidatus Cloacimonadota bacterium]|jgi:metal-dependent HD superfamily phosphatase/phosphodiesterase|nr:MAG: HD domain-containing protein [Candidatus Cloacimonadota bacterium]